MALGQANFPHLQIIFGRVKNYQFWLICLNIRFFLQNERFQVTLNVVSSVEIHEFRSKAKKITQEYSLSQTTRQPVFSTSLQNNIIKLQLPISASLKHQILDLIQSDLFLLFFLLINFVLYTATSGARPFSSQVQSRKKKKEVTCNIDSYGNFFLVIPSQPDYNYFYSLYDTMTKKKFVQQTAEVIHNMNQKGDHITICNLSSRKIFHFGDVNHAFSVCESVSTVIDQVFRLIKLTSNLILKRKQLSELK